MRKLIAVAVVAGAIAAALGANYIPNPFGGRGGHTWAAPHITPFGGR